MPVIISNRGIFAKVPKLCQALAGSELNAVGLPSIVGSWGSCGRYKASFVLKLLGTRAICYKRYS